MHVSQHKWNSTVKQCSLISCYYCPSSLKCLQHGLTDFICYSHLYQNLRRYLASRYPPATSEIAAVARKDINLADWNLVFGRSRIAIQPWNSIWMLYWPFWLAHLKSHVPFNWLFCSLIGNRPAMHSWLYFVLFSRRNGGSGSTFTRWQWSARSEYRSRLLEKERGENNRMQK